MKMHRITPFLWYDDQAEDAAKFYCPIFKKSKIHSISPMTVTFELDGQMFYALNGGPHFKFNPAVSFFINCKDQKEVDYYWNKLLKGGHPSQCGWLQDKYGLSWQVVPAALGECLGGKDRKGRRASHAGHDGDGETECEGTERRLCRQARGAPEKSLGRRSILPPCQRRTSQPSRSVCSPVAGC
jgi:predicted 3-demethylubiquinone-9 3-methyltransferase (glyoxalase superfamily)